MNTPRPLCQARTKAGAPCRRHAQVASDYCYVHRHLARQAGAEVQGEGDSAESTPLTADQLRQILAELNRLTQELRRRAPDMTVAAFSLSDLLNDLRAYLPDNLSPLAPNLPGGLWQDLQNSLQGVTVQDLRKPETWQGLWYLLNYSIQNQADAVNENLAKRLSGLPGMDRLAALAANLPGPRPAQLFDLATWQELLTTAAVSVQNQARAWRPAGKAGPDN